MENLRIRQIKNFFALTLLSVGTPMLLMGDEVRRTQQGNNNAYCMDDEIGWLDWELCKNNGDCYDLCNR
jgi:isoamylase